MPSSLGFEEVDEYCDQTICGLHHPTARSGVHVLCGHIHPGFRLSGGGTSLKVPCFVFGQEVSVLPAFGDFTGLGSMDLADGDRIFLVADDQIIPLGGEHHATRPGSLEATG